MLTETIFGYEILLISFCISVLFTYAWIRVAKRSKGMIVPDMNKHNKPKIPKTGGLAVVLAVILAIFFYIFVKTFLIQSLSHLIEILTFMIILLLACFIGTIDDIFGWKKSLKGWHKIIMTLPIALPLVVINAGQHVMDVPFMGAINFGLIYPLLLIPLAVIGTSNGFNMLAGYNGLEAGLGLVIFSFLGTKSLLTGQIWLAILAGIIIAALIGFLIFNKCPAKVFPGNSLTYSLGAMIAVFAILGNIEKTALILFIPFIIEGVLKARSKFKAQNFGIPNKDNSLELPYPKYYSLTHLSIKILKIIKPSKKVYEKDVVLLLVFVEILLGLIALA